MTRFDFCPWLFFEEADAEERAAQAACQARLCETRRVSFGEDCFISPLAGVFPDSLAMGDRCYIAAYAYVTDDIQLGADCSINPFATVRGKVVAGDGVRIGAHALILGFNHGFDSLDLPIFQQDMTTQGISIGDDVWIGSGAIVLDGVTIGSHSIVGAGAVVTRPVPDYAIVGGNPGRVLRSRRADVMVTTSPDSIEARLREFGGRVRQQWEELLRNYVDTHSRGACYVDQPDAGPSVRAWCDAVEIAALFGGVPELYAKPELVERLQLFQDAENGLLPEPACPPASSYDPWRLTDDLARYNILCVGYALELLGAHFLYPVRAVEAMTVSALYDNLNNLPWASHAWDCGDWIDSYATALYFNARYFNSQKTPDPLFGWLLTHVNPFLGLWGEPRREDGWLQPVNGFYRLTRGAHAQFDVPVPFPGAAIDTILAHSHDVNFFDGARGNACNVLDVTHALWLCGKQTEYRRADTQVWAKQQLDRALTRWIDGRGFSFSLEHGLDASRQPSLKGTEMWLSIIYLLAELIGASGALGYRSRGVHRLEPARDFQLDPI